MTPLLEVEHLTVTFERGGSLLKAVDDLTLTIEAGETLGLVGESGSGKSVTALAILRLLQPPGRVTSGRILFEGRDLLGLPETEMRSVRGGRISLIFQEPMTALNPTMRVGEQIAEALTAHGVGRDQARQRSVELLDAVRIPDPAARVRDFAHQLSGGMAPQNTTPGPQNRTRPTLRWAGAGVVQSDRRALAARHSGRTPRPGRRRESRRSHLHIAER